MQSAFGLCDLLYEFPAETRLTVYRRLDIEWKYSSFSKSNTETVAKPGRLGLAQNGKPMENFVESSMFCSMTLRKVQENLVERMSKINMDTTN